MDQNLPSFARRLPDGRVGLYLDSVLVGTFTECERKFYYRRAENWVLKATMGGGAAMNLGIWWSAALEGFYREMMLYQQRTEGARDASLRVLMEHGARAWVEQRMAKGAVADGQSFEERFNVAYGKFGGERGASRMLQGYWECFGEMDARNWQIIAMEAGFGLANEVILYEDQDLVICWCGRPDLIVFERNTNLLLDVDHKSKTYMKSNFISSFKPHPQTAGYVYSLGILCKQLGYDPKTVDRCMINGAGQYASENPRKKPAARYLRTRPHYSPEELEEWRYQTVEKAMRLWQAWKTGHYIPNEASCHIYAGCLYRDVCNIPPAARPIALESSYIKIEPWQPYALAGEEEDDE